MALPLQGLRVLDVSNVLAGPFCSFQLALLGAEVIKIEHPGTGDLARQLGADPDAAALHMGTSFVAVNAGKQSVTLNLKSAGGKEIFKKLVTISNVVVENFRPSVMDRLGLGYEVLSQLVPSLVYCAVTGFGQRGPLASRPAYDQIIQGMAGVMSITGDAQTAPLRVGFPVCDAIGGLTAALAICAVVPEARRTGQGRMIDVSMLEATLASMGWVLSNYLNAGMSPIPMGNDNFAAAPSGTFKTSAGLLNIAANKPEQYERLCEVLGRPEMVSDLRFCNPERRKENRWQLNEEIERSLAMHNAIEWETIFSDAGVPAGRVLSVPDILSHVHLQESKFVNSVEGTYGPQRFTRGGFKLEEGVVGHVGPAPYLSQHTDEWLRRLGYGNEAIERFHASGSV